MDRTLHAAVAMAVVLLVGLPSISALQSHVETPQAGYCTDENQTAGLGGQSVRCAFTCQKPGGAVTVQVDADDSDAGVSGTVSCASGNAHCSGHNSCSATDEYAGGGAGSCAADSDEAVDSGLYVSCSAEPEDQGPGSPLDDEWCPLPGYPVCVAPPANACLAANTTTLVTYVFRDPGPVDLDGLRCQARNHMVERVERDAEPGVAAAHIYSIGATAIGLVCRGLVCVEVEPVCVTGPGLLGPHTRCTV